MPGRFSSLANDTPTSTMSQVRRRCVAEPVDREIHADLADAAERREHEFALRTGHRHYLAAKNTSPAATVCIVPSARRRTKRPVSSMVSNWPASSPSPDLTRIGLPTPAARASQSARIAAKPAPRFHCARRGDHRGRQRREQAFRRGADAGGGEIGRRKIGAGRMMHAIDADPDRDARPLALDQDAGELVAVDQKIIRPFQHQPIGQARDAPADGVVQRERRDERQLGKALRRRRIGEQQARVEIAGLRHPGAAAPAAPRGLALRGDPQRPALAVARQRAALPHWSSRSCRGR